jgi:hypothetical protein
MVLAPKDYKGQQAEAEAAQVVKVLKVFKDQQEVVGAVVDQVPELQQVLLLALLLMAPVLILALQDSKGMHYIKCKLLRQHG